MFKPSEIADNYIGIAKGKVGSVWYKTLILAVLAGVFIAFGAVASTTAAADLSGSAAVASTTAAADLSGSAAAAVRGAVFPLGLILVVICGAELFTGNCLLIAPAVNRDIKVSGLFKNLGIVYGGNLIGGVLTAVLVVYSHAMSGTVAAAAIVTAANKCSLSFGDALLRGILCNMLVCLAVWGAMASKTVPGKILLVYLPVFAFVVCGFEHSIANMYYLPAGLMASAEYSIGAAGLSFGSAIVYNLIPVTIGNIIGGAAIALAYNFAVGRNKKEPDVAE